MRRQRTSRPLTAYEQSRFDEVKGSIDENGRFAVTAWPQPRTSNPNFLTEELESWQREQASQSPSPEDDET